MILIAYYLLFCVLCCAGLMGLVHRERSKSPTETAAD